MTLLGMLDKDNNHCLSFDFIVSKLFFYRQQEERICNGQSPVDVGRCGVLAGACAQVYQHRGSAQ